jgi:hypothetical protein
MGHPRFYELLEEMKKIHDRKNSDYSKKEDPLSNFRQVEEFGIPAWVGVLVRITDKYSRIVQLTNKALNGEEAEVKEESIKDTLVDLANYSVIAVILFEEWLKQKELDE